MNGTTKTNAHEFAVYIWNKKTEHEPILRWFNWTYSKEKWKRSKNG